MSCTAENPCRNSMLRWVHSERCQINTLTWEREILRKQLAAAEKLVEAVRAHGPCGYDIQEDCCPCPVCCAISVYDAAKGRLPQGEEKHVMSRDVSKESELPGLSLKPCPFCGGEAEVERFGTARRSCIINCSQCHCSLESNENGAGYHWNQRDHKD